MRLQLQFTVLVNATGAKLPLCCWCQQMCHVYILLFHRHSPSPSVCIKDSQASWSLLRAQNPSTFCKYTMQRNTFFLSRFLWDVQLVWCVRWTPLLDGQRTRKREQKRRKDNYSINLTHTRTALCVGFQGRREKETGRCGWGAERRQAREEKEGIIIYRQQILVISEKQRYVLWFLL